MTDETKTPSTPGNPPPGKPPTTVPPDKSPVSISFAHSAVPDTTSNLSRASVDLRKQFVAAKPDQEHEQEEETPR